MQLKLTAMVGVLPLEVMEAGGMLQHLLQLFYSQDNGSWIILDLYY